MDAQREISLEEWVNKLPRKHRARFEYNELRNTIASKDLEIQTLKIALSIARDNALEEAINIIQYLKDRK